MYYIKNKLHNNTSSIHYSHTFSTLGDTSSHGMDSTSEIIESSLPCRSLSQISLSCLYADRTSFRICKQKADILCLLCTSVNPHPSHCKIFRTVYVQKVFNLCDNYKVNLHFPGEEVGRNSCPTFRNLNWIHHISQSKKIPVHKYTEPLKINLMTS